MEEKNKIRIIQFSIVNLSLMLILIIFLGLILNVLNILNIIFLSIIINIIVSIRILVKNKKIKFSLIIIICFIYYSIFNYLIFPLYMN